MRFFSGLIFGFILAVGIAYIHDTGPERDALGQNRRMVNWDVVGGSVADLTGSVREAWNRLIDRRDERAP